MPGHGRPPPAGLPLAVVVVALLRRDRPRARFRTAALWTALTLAAVPAHVVVLLAAVIPLSFVADIVFSIEGYEPGLFSLVPPALAMMLPVALLAASGPDGRTREAPRPVLQPVGSL
ncbi:hypothetical protein [Catenuloplanes japonicus]|uniref:hypothetical protein n=1 Tax=Catenuloplanes japonicus TaxID=33876 RepID=UPI000525B459|nr:hypothetical protein [Catenuloplanes japonicus]